MIVTQNKTTTLYSYQNGIGANTEAILNRTLRHILYGDLYVNGGNGNGGNGNGGNGEIPSNEMHFTTVAGSVSYVGSQGDQILLSDNSIVDIIATGITFTFNVPSGRHIVKLVESRESSNDVSVGGGVSVEPVGENNYVSVGGEALVELHNFPTLSTVTKFNFSTYVYNPLPNLTKVPNFLPSNITSLDSMFYNATNFNQDIGMWNVSNVTNMNGMFINATSFNQPLNNWNVSSVTDMSGMFIGGGMRGMFRDASAFNQDLSMWCVSNLPTTPDEFNTGAPFLVGAKLPVWGTCPAP